MNLATINSICQRLDPHHKRKRYKQQNLRQKPAIKPQYASNLRREWKRAQQEVATFVRLTVLRPW